MDPSSFERGVRRCIPSEFVMIAGSADNQEAWEVYNAVSRFDLPHTKGKEGGLCTSLLLQALYQNVPRVVAPSKASSSTTPLTCQQLLKSMYTTSKTKGYTPVPQMTASRPLDAKRPFYIVPPGSTGRRRALIIGINYTGQEGQLRAPQNDAHNVQQLLVRECGFNPQEILMLVDDGKQMPPTKRHIQAGLQQMVAYSRPGDVLVVSFSGHGGRRRVANKSGVQENEFDSSLMPVDFSTNGQIVDDDLLKHFIKAIPAGVHTTMLVDACHCGSVGDLPYSFSADQSTYKMEKGFNMDTYQEAMAKDKAAYEAEQEKKRAKAERKKEREAIRQRRAEQEALENAAAASTSPPGVLNATTRLNQAPVTIQANSPEELKALASKYGAAMQVSPRQMAALAKQGGGTISTGPIMMTPGQAAAFQAQHSKGGGPVVMVGKPVTKVVGGGYKQPVSPTKVVTSSPARKKVAGTSRQPATPTKVATSSPMRKVATLSPAGVASLSPSRYGTTVKSVTCIAAPPVYSKTTETTKAPVSPTKTTSRMAALRSKFGG